MVSRLEQTLKTISSLPGVGLPKKQKLLWEAQRDDMKSHIDTILSIDSRMGSLENTSKDIVSEIKSMKTDFHNKFEKLFEKNALEKENSNRYKVLEKIASSRLLRIALFIIGKILNILLLFLVAILGYNHDDIRRLF